MKHKLTQPTGPVSLFFSYASEDEALRNMLAIHLNLLQRQGIISTWYNHQIVAGAEQAQAISTHLEAASIILLLVSPHFLASSSNDIEMQRALELHRQGKARVIPIILRPSDWRNAPFTGLQYLPRNGKPITTWDNQDDAFAKITQELRQIIQKQAIPLHPGLPLSSFERRHRQRLLKKVQSRWITTLLKPLLDQQTLLTLNLQERPDALINPWDQEVQETNQPSRSLPEGTSIIEVYDSADGELLILGQPGSGKTILLLELARNLLEHAESNEQHPMPVIFNLSAWAKKQQSLTDWLVEELTIKYLLPSKLARSLLATDQILPLLDGLDEVDAKARTACINTINSYREEHDLSPLVVCSRIDDYLAQNARVRLSSAVQVQPLTSQQIEQYLLSTGPSVEALRVAVRNDPDLQTLATTPLMLTILTQTYRGTQLQEIAPLGTLPAKQQQIFAAYVERMFKRRGVEKRYNKQEQTKRWLTKLAQQVKQAEFYIEQMQPAEWLKTRTSNRIYRGILGGLVGGSALGLPIGLILGLMGNITTIPLFAAYQNFCLEESLRVKLGIDHLTHNTITLITTSIFLLIYVVLSMAIGGLVIGLASGIVTGLFNTKNIDIQPTEIILWSWTDMWQGFAEALLIGLIGTGFIELFFSLNIVNLLPTATSIKAIGPSIFDPNSGYPLIAIIGGILVGPGSGLIGGTILGMVKKWSTKSAQTKDILKKNILTGLLIGSLGFLPGALLFLSLGPLLSVACTSAGIGLIIGIIRGFSQGKLKERVKPNEGIRRSLRNSSLIAFFSIVSWLLFGWLGWLVIGWTATKMNTLLHTTAFQADTSLLIGTMITTFILGVLSGVILGLRNGGYACIQHFALRLLLWQNRSIPWNYPRFLDSAAERILLHKVGGGYIFIHRLLQEYFASLEPSTPTLTETQKTEQISQP